MKKSSLLQSAEKLASITPYARYPYVSAVSHVMKGVDNIRVMYGEVIEPQWNSLAEIVNKAGGYQVLVEMYERLKQRRDEAANTYKSHQQTVDTYEMFISILEYETIEFGPDSTLNESFHSGDNLNRNEGKWSWRIERKDDNEQIGAQQNYYILEVSEEYKESYYATDIPNYLIPLHGEHSWSVVLGWASDYGRRFLVEYRRYDALLNLINFRISVVNGVLSEYELLGYVNKYILPIQDIEEKSSKDSQAEFDDIPLQMITYGLKVYDESPESFKTRSSLLAKVAGEYGYADYKGAEGRLKTAGYYEPKGDGSKPTTGESRQWLNEMLEHWRLIIETEKRN